MFISKKDLEEFSKKINQSIERIEKSIEASGNNFNSLIEKKHSDVLDKIRDVDERNSFLGKELEKEISKFKRLNENLKKRVDSLRILENWLRENFIKEVKSEMSNKMDFLDQTTADYNKFRDSLLNTKSKLMKIEEEIAKFLHISNSIKQADFELSKYAREIEKEDREKLRLMRENENLKHIISKERRSRRRQI